LSRLFQFVVGLIQQRLGFGRMAPQIEFVGFLGGRNLRKSLRGQALRGGEIRMKGA
jgi:hypothetical protein